MAEMNFSDLGSVISMLSSNPEMLKMLSGLMSSQASSPEPPKSAPQPDALASIMSMLGGQKNGDELTRNPQISQKPPSPLSVFGSSEEIKNRIVLLSAVRPYLSETRKERLETVIKMLRLAELGGLSSLLK